MNKPLEIGSIHQLECKNPQAGNKEKAVYVIDVVILETSMSFGRHRYVVTPVSGSGKFSVSGERIK